MGTVKCSNGGMNALGLKCPSYSGFESCCKHLAPMTCDYSIIPNEISAQVADAEFKKSTSAEEPESVLDIQIDGEHYKKLGQYQPWQVCAACMTPEELRGYMKGTVIAYLMRERDKGGDSDIRKAAHTIQLWEEVRKDK